MASFTDKLLNFNPYISEVPVDDYIRVGMWKQQQYDAGVEKVQGYIDNIKGLEVVKDVHKDYLNQTLGNLQTSIGKVVSSDFSNNQLVNQVGGLISKIKRDPILQNAVISTANYKKGVADMDKARTEGKGAVENDYAFQSQAQKWLTDKDPHTSFNGSYTPYIDVRKKMFDIIKATGEDSSLTQIPFRRNMDGSVQLDGSGHPVVDDAMIESSTTGKSAEKIKRAVQLGLNESDINQLNLEAQYHFRGQDARGMKDITDRSYQSRLNNLNTRLADLQIQRATNTNDPIFQNKINDELKSVKDASDGLVQGYKQDMEALNSNPEGFKNKLYVDNYLEQVGNTFSTSKVAFKYETNPYRQQLNNERDFKLRWEEFQDKQIMERARLDLEKYKIDHPKDGKTAKETAGLISNPLIDPNQPKDDTLTIDDFKNDMKANEGLLNASKSSVLNSDTFWGIKEDDKYEKLQQLRTSYDQGKQITPIVAEYFRNTDRIRLDLDNKKAALMNVESKLPSLDALVQGKTGMTIHTPDGRAIGFTPTELVEFNDKWTKVSSQPTSPRVGSVPSIIAPKLDEITADKLFTSPKEKFLYDVKKREFYGGRQDDNDKIINSKLWDIKKSVNNYQGAVIANRNDIASTEVQKIMNQYKPERYSIDVGNTQKMTDTRSLVDDLLSRAETNKKSVGVSPNFDYDDARKLNSDKANATYSVYKKGDKAYVVINGNAGIKSQYIPVTTSELNSRYNGAFERQFDPIQQTLALTDGRTTNVQGRGAETAYFQRHDFPAITKYGVTADINKGVSGYQLQLHIYDPRIKDWVDRTPFYGEPEEVLKKIGTVGDLTIEQLLQLTPAELKKIEDDKNK